MQDRYNTLVKEIRRGLVDRIPHPLNPSTETMRLTVVRNVGKSWGFEIVRQVRNADTPDQYWLNTKGTIEVADGRFEELPVGPHATIEDARGQAKLAWLIANAAAARRVPEMQTTIANLNKNIAELEQRLRRVEQKAWPLAVEPA